MFKFLDKPVPDRKVVQEYTDELSSSETPIIIDNGSSECRAGWATSKTPELVFKNIIAKNRSNKKDKAWDILVGNEIKDLESVRWLLRSPFDFNIVVNYSVQETLLDYCFGCLGINTEGSVNHPILMTEPITNPTVCRNNMSELLFEAYNVPSLLYGVDCLFSYAHNRKSDTGLIISSGFQTSHVLPVINGSADFQNCRRINLGGYNCSAYLQRILQLKHPKMLPELTLTKMEEVKFNFAEIPANYDVEMSKWKCKDYRHKNSTILMFKDADSPHNDDSESLKSTQLSLEKELKQLEHRYHEVECVLEVGEEAPDILSQVTDNPLWQNIDSLKSVQENLQENIDEKRQQITDHYNSYPNLDTASVPLGIEKIQVPEILFQPSMVGYNQMGLTEAMEYTLRQYDEDVQHILANNVFLTGGNTKTLGFKERIISYLKEIRPFKSEIKVEMAADPLLDTWIGAAEWINDNNETKHWFTKLEYEEHGGDFIKQNTFSNIYNS